MGIQIDPFTRESATACEVRGVSDAPSPCPLQDLCIVVRHDHLGSQVGVDDAIIDGHGVIYDGHHISVGIIVMWSW